MDSSFHVRRGWLKAMYLYTLIGAGGTGFGMVFFPDVMQSTLGLPAQDPVVFKLYGSVLLSPFLHLKYFHRSLSCPGLANSSNPYPPKSHSLPRESTHDTAPVLAPGRLEGSATPFVP